LAVAVLAAGKGVRMRSKLPKVLHSIVGRPMLLHILEAVREVGATKTFVITNPHQTGVRARLDGDVAPVAQPEPLGTGHALLQIAKSDRPSGTLLVLYGDTPLLRPRTLVELVNAHRGAGAQATVLTAELVEPQGYGRVLRGPDGKLARIVEEKDATPAERRVREINTGIYCFEGRSLWPALARVSRANRAREFYLPDVFAHLPGTLLLIKAKDPDEVLGINDRRQLAEAERILRRRILDAHMVSGVTIVDPASTFVDASVKIGRDTSLAPFTIITGKTVIGEDCMIGPYTQIANSRIGKGCRIERSHLVECVVGDKTDVGPFSRLRRGVELATDVHVGSFAELKKAKIGAGSKVPHFSYTGDAVVGRNVNIGAGAITCNWDGWQHHETRIGDDVFVGSDTMMVAPVKIGARAFTGAGSTITKDVPADSLAIERAEQRNVEGWAKRRRAKAAKKKR
jgi:bifunctional UDP-N-acetylglucosamine pyrophosphorylase/glucosamine-1-phosphate N-acetyltransferase